MSTAPPLLATKLYLPLACSALVSRPRLIARLNEGLTRALTLVCAPAGFGKTTLVSEWAGRAPAAVAWLSLDDDDNDPRRFLTYLVAALASRHEGVGAAALALLQSPEPVAPKSILTMLINDLTTLAGPFVLVLDDYHLIQIAAIHEALTLLLDRLPPHLRLVIISRADPTLPLSRWRARGQLTDIRAADLRFTAEEAGRFLNQVMGLELSERDVATLETRTEGWIAGLQLAALSMQGADDTPGFIAAFSGSNRYILDYLVEEVLNRQPEVVHSFLLATSVLDRLCAPLCDALLETDDTGFDTPQDPLVSSSPSQALLKQLEHANLFLVPLDAERRWYRYHHLFGEVLRSRLRQQGRDRVQGLHWRASVWYEHNGSPAEAIRHAFAAGDFERAAALIEAVGIALFAQPTIQHSLSRWLAALPPEMARARPRLCLIQAWVLFNRHDIPAALDCAYQAEQAFQSAAGADGDQNLRGEIAAIQAMLVAYRPDPDLARVITKGQAALVTLSFENSTFRALAAAAVGLAYMKQGDIQRAEQAFGEAASMGRASGNTYIAVAATTNHIGLQRASGALRLARATCQAAFEWLADRGGLADPHVSRLHCSLADLLRETNDLEAAQRSVDNGTSYSDLSDNAALIAASRFVLMRIRQAQGDWEGAWAIWRQLSHTPPPVATTYVPLLAATAAQFRVAQGDLTAAWQWAQAVDWEEGMSFPASTGYHLIFIIEHRRLARAQVFLAYGRATADAALLHETLAHLERQARAAEAAGLVWLRIKVYALQALTQAALEHQEQAQAALIRALTLAEPEGYIRLFVDEGPPMAELLRRLETGDWRLSQYIDKLLSAFPGAVPVMRLQAPVSRLQSPLVEPLSERELQVLRLVAAGLSNQDIADRLIVTRSTVKKHVNNIFGKLAVRSRTQALARARDLHLLR